jgi:hypothetical protein
MIRIAIFVEGQTERKFVKKLISKRYGHLVFKIDEIVRRGRDTYIPKKGPRQSIGLNCYFLLVEVPSYEKITSYVIDNAPTMVAVQDFKLLLGLRDLFPKNREDKELVINSIDKILRKSPVYDKINIILAIMETEAWFLCDWQMFERIDARLTSPYIQTSLGLDIVNNDPELVYSHPSRTLDEILKLANLRYRKHGKEIDVVVSNIDVTYLCSCTDKIDSFFNFIRHLDTCMPSS